MDFDTRLKEIFDSKIFLSAKKFVEDVLKENDGSHKMDHIDRVLSLAVRICKDEFENTPDIELVVLGALLHDVEDRKYKKKGEPVKTVRGFLKEMKYKRVEDVVLIVDNVSFTKELDGKRELSFETKIVQDADRLDAIGAKKHILYDPKIPPRVNLKSKEYKDTPNTAINHFYEKLLKIKDLMKTQTGRNIAEKRHQFMELYLKTFKDEWVARD